jgi:hypothetical protein
MFAAKLQRQRLQGGVDIEQHEVLQRSECLSRRPTRRARTRADIEQAARREVVSHLDKRVQAGGDRGIGCGHPHQCVGQCIGFGRDDAGISTVAIGF